MHLIFHNVTFGYDSSPDRLFREVSFHLSSGWCGVIGANGAGKSTLLQLACGRLQPLQGSIAAPALALYCPQRTDDPPAETPAFLQSTERDALLLKDRLAIADDFGARWHTLSHGERKRLQLGVALWLQPDLLAVDEPTNHLDAYARGLIAQALASFSGIGLLVSHDRELLDRLCQACIQVAPPAVTWRPGGASAVLAILDQERQALQRQREIQKRQLQELQREVLRRKQEARQADHKRSKRHIPVKDRDAKARIDAARVSGKDGHAGKLQKQLQGRLEQMSESFAQIRTEKTHTLGIWLPGSKSRRVFLFSEPGGSILMGGERQLHYPDLCVKSDDRIAITGPNGAGKSTLVRHLLQHVNLQPERITYIPQEIDVLEAKSILAQALELPSERRGQVFTIVSRLNSRPERLLASAEPSPGEVRKLLLALGMSLQPHLIIMDEPTNHLDLPSILCLEEALAECPCALILVSHDAHFLARLTRITWSLSTVEDESILHVV